MFLPIYKQRKESLIDKVQGVILGAALGNALGKRVLPETIHGGSNFTSAEKNDLATYWYKKAFAKEFTFSDDIHQLRLVVESLLNTGGKLVPEDFAKRLKLRTEEGFPEMEMSYGYSGFTIGAALDHPEFTSDPHKIAMEVWIAQGRDLAANGALMRTAACGIPFFFKEPQVALNAINCAKVTHADPRCVFSSVVVSVLISRLLEKTLSVYSIKRYDKNEGVYSKSFLHDKNEIQILKSAMKTTSADQQKSCANPIFWTSEDPVHPKEKFWAPLSPSHASKRYANRGKQFHASDGLEHADKEISHLIKQVIEDYQFLLDDENEPEKSAFWKKEVEKFSFWTGLENLGLDDRTSKGYTLKCLAAALNCFSRKIKQVGADTSPSQFFLNMMTELVIQGGDTDTNCAVAGALLGVRLGLKGLPKEWIKELKGYKSIKEISNRLFKMAWDQYKSR